MPSGKTSPALARGLALIESLPQELVEDLVHGPAVEAEGVEQWLESGQGDPWQVKIA